MDNLPIELVKIIISATGHSNKINISMVSRTWKKICDDSIYTISDEYDLRQVCYYGDIYSVSKTYCLSRVKYPKHLMIIACNTRNSLLLKWLFSLRIDSASIRHIFRYTVAPICEFDCFMRTILEYIKTHNLIDAIDFLLEGACESGNIELVNKLLDHGISRPELGIYSSCNGGEKSIFDLMMLKCGARLTHIYWPVVFECACKGGNIELVRLSYKKSNKHVNLKKAIHNACYSGNELCVNYVMYIGSKYFNDGLHGACRGGHMNLVKLMIFYGAHDINTGVKYAVEGNNLDIVTFLISKGAYAIYDSLIVACRYGNIPMVQYLLNYIRTDPNWHNCYMAAIQSGNIDLVKILEVIIKDYNIDINYNLCLKKSCIYGHIDISKYIIDKLSVNSICEHCGVSTSKHI